MSDPRVNSVIKRSEEIIRDFMPAWEGGYAVSVLEVLSLLMAENKSLKDQVATLSIGEGWIDCKDQMPEPSCDVNDLLLWCPDHGLGMCLVLGQYDGVSFTADFELDDDFNEVRRSDLYVTHWMPAPSRGPCHKNSILIRADSLTKNSMQG